MHYDNDRREASLSKRRSGNRRGAKAPWIIPSFNGRRPASPASSKAKRANRATGTKHEATLARRLWACGLRYRKNVASLPGKPDIVFSAARTAIFCDGDFWHGRDWPQLERKLRRGTNSSYWLAKIRTNMRRDAATTAQLVRMGWKVVRVWERDTIRNPDKVARSIKRILNSRM